MRAKTFIVVFSIAAWQLSIAQTFGPGACTPIPNSQTCVDATPCKVDASGINVCLAGSGGPPGALSIPQVCWQYTYQYACADATQAVSTCAPYESNTACSVVASSCQNFAQPSGLCDTWNYTYKCQTSAAVTTPQVTCTGGLFNNGLFPTPSNPNNTFATAVVAQEILRESQVYSNQGTEIFKGVKETCRKGYGGLQNCCKTMPGAKSNSAVAQASFAAGASVVKYYGGQAVDWASSYMFDAMYNSGLWTDAMTSAFATGGDSFGTSFASSGFSVGAYGFTYSTASTTGGGLFGANVELFGSAGNGFVMFNPYVLIAALIIMYIQSLTACTSDEQMLGMHKGANLSVYESEACTSKFLGSCLQYTDTYCSFNSILAKIINTQGKPQLGLDVTDCTGFTIAQVGQLDFTKIDFSEFAASITAQAQASVPTSAGINQAYTPILQGTTAGSAQNGTMVPGSTVIGGTKPNPASVNPALPTYPPPGP